MGVLHRRLSIVWIGSSRFWWEKRSKGVLKEVVFKLFVRDCCLFLPDSVDLFADRFILWLELWSKESSLDFFGVWCLFLVLSLRWLCFLVKDDSLLFFSLFFDFFLLDVSSYCFHQSFMNIKVFLAFFVIKNISHIYYCTKFILKIVFWNYS